MIGNYFPRIGIFRTINATYFIHIIAITFNNDVSNSEKCDHSLDFQYF